VCGLECDLTVSREHLLKAHAMHEEVRTYEERVAALTAEAAQPLVQLQGPGAGGRGPEGSGEIPSPTPDPRPPTPTYRYRATFEKGEQVKYLSHLDMTRTLPRAFRRARVRLGYSQGFHPMPLIQYGPALGVGTVGENELIDFDTFDELDEADFLQRINASLPSGFRFKRLERLTPTSPSLVKEVNRADWLIALDVPEIQSAVARLLERRAALVGNAREIDQALADEFLARESLVIERVRKDKRQRIDVRRYTRALRVDAATGGLVITTEMTPQGGVKPIEVVAAIYELTEGEKLSISSRVRRLRLYQETAALNPAPGSTDAAFASMQ